MREAPMSVCDVLTVYGLHEEFSCSEKKNEYSIDIGLSDPATSYLWR